MLPKEQRLKRYRVEYLLRKGRLIRTRFFVVKFQYNRSVNNRFAVVVSTKVAKLAVDRNRLRRQIFEAIRQDSSQLGELESTVDCIVIAKPNANESNYADISEDIVRTFSLIK